MTTLGDLTTAITDVITEATEFYAACYGSQERSDMFAVRFDVWSSNMATIFLLQPLNSSRCHQPLMHLSSMFTGPISKQHRGELS